MTPTVESNTWYSSITYEELLHIELNENISPYVLFEQFVVYPHTHPICPTKFVDNREIETLFRGTPGGALTSHPLNLTLLFCRFVASDSTIPTNRIIILVHVV